MSNKKVKRPKSGKRQQQQQQQENQEPFLSVPILFDAVALKKSDPPKEPEYAIFCELDLDVTNSILGYCYSEITHVDLSNNTQFNNLLQKFAAFKPLGLSTSIQEYRPCPSSLSLSIGGNQQSGGKAELAHVVIRLSSKYRWRFTEQYKDGNRPPFGAASEYTPAVLSDAIRVASDGTTWDDSYHFGSCLVARFIADPRHLGAGERNRFNINLDVLDGRERVIPIIIDPDVGYPGGNGGG
jgi:hypothetical protein